ncbi:pimeloyl-ACP methyl ester carboxylesterase [Sphingomonas naasensis]|uniref:Alpha/beta hydrolase n=1 Tax=Sphingomonas naasensis TaxID=1344951 RepID=A0A4S1WG34_9SPHN|nr:alpha/beta hydrolase [Sphingomonas naasensis]NIJ21460.1 pimeloyl-ACP methyl ester carboxylesterase [Sphingomonas naasensis]TGX41583.1 alpha/beta hydrolase [Sphingomonas naasensis]
MLIPLGLVGVFVLGLAGWSAYVGRKAEEMVPAEGKFADVPGACIHYVDLNPEAGGPAIVMVHGLMGQLRNFSHALAGRLAVDHRVILVDRPGWGHSQLHGPRPGIAAQAAMIAALIEQLELDKPLVVGHSMGGAVSLALGLNRPERVRGLALIAPLSQVVATVPAPFKGLLAPPALHALLAWTVAVPVGVRKGKETAAAIFAPDPVPADFALAGGGALALRPKSYLAGAFEVNAAPGEMAALVARYGEMRVPVAILFGRSDAVLDPALNGERTAAEIPGATIALVDGGHMLPITHATQTEAWLRGLPGVEAQATGGAVTDTV